MLHVGGLDGKIRFRLTSQAVVKARVVNRNTISYAQRMS